MSSWQLDVVENIFSEKVFYLTAIVDNLKLISNLIVTRFILKNKMTRNHEKLEIMSLLKQKYFPYESWPLKIAVRQAIRVPFVPHFHLQQFKSTEKILEGLTKSDYVFIYPMMAFSPTPKLSVLHD